MTGNFLYRKGWRTLSGNYRSGSWD